MDAEKYNRNVNLLCPTCGSTHFEYETGVEEIIEMVKCASCGRSLTRDELLSENSENIHEHLSEIQQQATKDIAKEVKDALKKAFGGSKNIRIK
jgi:uncharacterized Zn finger protein (UPF0148 family)